METFKVAIAGFGRIAQVHAQAWQSLEGANVTAIFDDSPVARHRGAEAGFTPYAGLDEMVEQERPDVVSICTPPVSH